MGQMSIRVCAFSLLHCMRQLPEVQHFSLCCIYFEVLQHYGWEFMVTGQLADKPTRGLPTRGLDDSRTGHLADWSTRGLDNSRTGQVADWTTRGCHRWLCMLSFRFWRHLRDRELSSPRLVQSASWPVREMSSPRDVQSASWQSASWRIRELSSYRIYYGSLPLWDTSLQFELVAISKGMQAVKLCSNKILHFWTGMRANTHSPA